MPSDKPGRDQRLSVNETIKRMKNHFIGKDKIFTREQLKMIKGGTEDWDTYYEGMECGRDGRPCETSVNCQDLACSACLTYWGGGLATGAWNPPPGGPPPAGWPTGFYNRCT